MNLQRARQLCELVLAGHALQRFARHRPSCLSKTGAGCDCGLQEELDAVTEREHNVHRLPQRLITGGLETVYWGLYVYGHHLHPKCRRGSCLCGLDETKNELAMLLRSWARW